ncbi:hypothetical protein H257_18355 [Aphanomyces astaci]|uniref:Peroxisomal membrane protein PEX14 n=1 Tax=Aphanomyces astaci TaxID=112090 RepID=W4FD68_APHAT|nr:hypothetical protein H257_18355 [Aphanomyces astaci]ETV64839.1 hypothetical protein H257_18355 [Aphanomyces astaci]|eukprot:XP_009845696.1 hypothetical protein H257_18355 [Aphanomyces astaci]
MAEETEGTTPSSLDVEKINSGVRFLGHPDVQATPLSERLAFLEKKGLSRAEINAAIEKHQQAMPLAVAEPAQSLTSLAWSILFPAISAATLMGVLWRFLRNDDDTATGSGSSRDLDHQGVPAKSPLQVALDTQTEELRKVVHLLQEETKSRRMQSVEQLEHAREIARLHAEIAALKLKLATGDDDSINPKAPETSTGHPAPPDGKLAEVAHGKSTEEAFQAQVHTFLEALRLVEADNSTEVIQHAAAVLVMYTKNLVEHPGVPRYRRIAIGNANFKLKIEPLVHYDALLSSIGFDKAGTNYLEWKWHAAPVYNTHVAILKAAIHAFEHAATSCSLVDSARRHLQSSREAPPTASSDQEVQTVVPAEHNNLASFLDKLKPKVDVEPTTEGEATTAPTFPPTFSEVAKMVQNGDTVPGIREIEDKLSSDTDKILSAATAAASQQAVVAKPWNSPS